VIRWTCSFILFLFTKENIKISPESIPEIFVKCCLVYMIMNSNDTKVKLAGLVCWLFIVTQEVRLWRSSGDTYAGR
jgi:hypothetical protein